MAKSKIAPFVLKQFFVLLLCVCLIAGICCRPVESTISYITSFSDTCVNTFEGEAPDEPRPPLPTPPETGESSEPDWYMVGMLLCLAGFVFIWKIGYRREKPDY